MVKQAKSTLTWLGERAAAGLSIAAVSSIVFGFAWLVARNEVVGLLGELSGVSELTEEIRLGAAQTTATLDRLTAIVESNAEQIRAFHPPEVAEYDKLLSKIFSPCAAGGECEAQFRVRRTQFGETCGLPTVLGRVVTDRSGLEYPVPPPRTSAQRLNGEWAMRPIIFQVPARAPEGVASFHLVLEYECGTQGTFAEETPRLPFEIIRP